MATTASFNWLPSTARVVTVDGFGPFPRGAMQAQPFAMVWPAKDPGDVLDFIVDYSEALAGNIGDTIASLDVSIMPNNAGDLTLNESRADGSQAILWFANGQVGTTYSVTLVVGTNGGRVIARTVSLPVTALAVISSASANITDQAGAPLVNQAGAALTTG